MTNLNYSPLVTISISTYNSGKFIIETLDSILEQTYHNLELVIGDDASTDNTLEIIDDWLSKDSNRNFFQRVKIIEVEKNTGTSANANRKLAAANGEWLKPLGADDVFLPNCIMDNINFIRENSDARIVFSRVNLYQNNFTKSNFMHTTPREIQNDSILWPDRTAESQYRMLLVCDRIHFSPSVFLHRETIKSVGGYDERFRLLDDYPLWLNLTRAGTKLYFMDKETVNYRQHMNAINNTGESYFINPNYFKQQEFRKIYTYPNLPRLIRFHQNFIWFVSQIFRKPGRNQNRRFNVLLLNILSVYLNPFKYIIWFKRSFNSSLRNHEFYK